jgi:hypothetical protein
MGCRLAKLGAVVVLLVFAWASGCAASRGREARVLVPGEVVAMLFEREIPPELKERGEVIESPWYLPMEFPEELNMAAAREIAQRSGRNASVFRVVVRRDGKGQMCIWTTRRGTVVFERNPGDEVLNRHALAVVTIPLEDAEAKKAPGEIVAGRRARKNEMALAVRMDLLFDEDSRPYLNVITWNPERDLVDQEEFARWREAAQKRLSCGRSFSGYRLHESMVTRGHPGLMDIWYEYAWCSDLYQDPNGRWVAVTVVERQEGNVSLHTFLGTVMPGDCRMEKTDIGGVIVSGGQWSGQPEQRIAWPSGERVVVIIQTWGEPAKRLLQVYGERFPSSLPPNTQIDRVQWARAEVDLWLSRWRQLSEVPVSERREARSVEDCKFNIDKWLYAEGVYGNAALPRQEAARKSYETLARWWVEHREKTYWDEKIRKLVSPDYAPEHVGEAQRKRAEEERRQAEAELMARLNEPLPDEQRAELRPRLIKEFTEFMKDRASGSWQRFEQVGVGAWEYSEEIFPKRKVWSYYGPLTRRSRDLLYPLEGVFSTQSPAGEKGQMTYYYDRLADKWVMGKVRQREWRIRGVDLRVVSPMEADRPVGRGEPAEAGKPGQEAMPAVGGKDDRDRP